MGKRFKTDMQPSNPNALLQQVKLMPFVETEINR